MVAEGRKLGCVGRAVARATRQHVKPYRHTSIASSQGKQLQLLQQLKLFALTAGDGGVPVWFDMLSGGTGDSTTYAPQFTAFSNHARLARFLPLEDIILIGDRKMPTAENQVMWLRLHLGYIGPITLQDHHCQTLRDLLDAGHTWQALPYVAKRDEATLPAQRTLYRGLGHTV